MDDCGRRHSGEPRGRPSHSSSHCVNTNKSSDGRPRSGGSGRETTPDSAEAQNGGVRVPHPHDVLCGRGGASIHHEGNAIYRSLVDKVKKLYVSCPRTHKRIVARSVVEALQVGQTPSGRFLEKKGDLWYQITLDAAIEKTKQSLRETRVFVQRAESDQEDNSLLNGADSDVESSGDIRKRKRSHGEEDERSAEAQNGGIRVPHPHDVLCGRGGASNNHEGNAIYRSLADKVKKLYMSCPRTHKRIVARSVVEALQVGQTPPGRFLEKKGDLWYQITLDAAIKKTEQSLRETRVFGQSAESHQEDKSLPNGVDSDVESSGDIRKRKRSHGEEDERSTFAATAANKASIAATEKGREKHQVQRIGNERPMKSSQCVSATGGINSAPGFAHEHIRYANNTEFSREQGDSLPSQRQRGKQRPSCPPFGVAFVSGDKTSFRARLGKAQRTAAAAAEPGRANDAARLRTFSMPRPERSGERRAAARQEDDGIRLRDGEFLVREIDAGGAVEKEDRARDGACLNFKGAKKRGGKRRRVGMVDADNGMRHKGETLLEPDHNERLGDEDENKKAKGAVETSDGASGEAGLKSEETEARSLDSVLARDLERRYPLPQTLPAGSCAKELEMEGLRYVIAKGLYRQPAEAQIQSHMHMMKSMSHKWNLKLNFSRVGMAPEAQSIHDVKPAGAGGASREDGTGARPASSVVGVCGGVILDRHGRLSGQKERETSERARSAARNDEARRGKESRCPGVRPSFVAERSPQRSGQRWGNQDRGAPKLQQLRQQQAKKCRDDDAEKDQQQQTEEERRRCCREAKRRELLLREMERRRSAETPPSSRVEPLSASRTPKGHCAAEAARRGTKKVFHLCLLCRRKFPSVDALRLHRERSALHRANALHVASKRRLVPVSHNAVRIVKVEYGGGGVDQQHPIEGKVLAETRIPATATQGSAIGISVQCKVARGSAREANIGKERIKEEETDSSKSPRMVCTLPEKGMCSANSERDMKGNDPKGHDGTTQTQGIKKRTDTPKTIIKDELRSMKRVSKESSLSRGRDDENVTSWRKWITVEIDNDSSSSEDETVAEQSDFSSLGAPLVTTPLKSMALDSVKKKDVTECGESSVGLLCTSKRQTTRGQAKKSGTSNQGACLLNMLMHKNISKKLQS